MLLSEMWLFVDIISQLFVDFLKYFFLQDQAYIPLFQTKPLFLTSVRMQSDNILSLSFLLLWQKGQFLLSSLHARFPKPLITIDRAEM